MAEMKAASARPQFGSVELIKSPDFVREGHARVRRTSGCSCSCTRMGTCSPAFTGLGL